MSNAVSDPAVQEFFSRLKAQQRERAALVQPAVEALDRLVACCAGASGQSYKLRALLFSLWNGKPAELLETVSLDWTLKKDFCAVVLAFGHDEFFYRQLERAFEARGLLDWFRAEGEERK
jgi:uncharacterized protein YukE